MSLMNSLYSLSQLPVSIFIKTTIAAESDDEGGYQFCTGPGHNDNPTQTPQGSQPALDIFTSQCELPLLQTEPSKRLEKYGYGYVGFYSFN